MTDEQNKPELNLDRPADRSLEAFKQWVREMVDALGGSSKSEMTEQDWLDMWKQFWKDEKD